MTNLPTYTEQNRRAWNEIAQVREQRWPDAPFFAQGGSLLDRRVLDAAGIVEPEKPVFWEKTGFYGAHPTLLHLQCATGEETLSWAGVGATATGVDISDEQIVLAQRKAADAGLDVRFVAADVYTLPDELQQVTFDIVYTGGGALTWLPDIGRWAEVVARALCPGGRFILFEEHPVAACFWYTDGQLQFGSDYFGRGQPQFDQGWSHFAGGEDARETKVEFSWPLGDVVTALAQAGLTIERLEEYPSDAEWRFGPALDQARRLPGEYLLVASLGFQPQANHAKPSQGG